MRGAGLGETPRRGMDDASPAPACTRTSSPSSSERLDGLRRQPRRASRRPRSRVGQRSSLRGSSWREVHSDRTAAARGTAQAVRDSECSRGPRTVGLAGWHHGRRDDLPPDVPLFRPRPLGGAAGVWRSCSQPAAAPGRRRRLGLAVGRRRRRVAVLRARPPPRRSCRRAGRRSSSTRPASPSVCPAVGRSCRSRT